MGFLFRKPGFARREEIRSTDERSSSDHVTSIRCGLLFSLSLFTQIYRVCRIEIAFLGRESGIIGSPDRFRS
jgi:hypothetical protein